MIPVNVKTKNATYTGVVDITITDSNVLCIRLTCPELNVENLRLIYNGDCVTCPDDILTVSCWKGFEQSFYGEIEAAYGNDNIYING